MLFEGHLYLQLYKKETSILEAARILRNSTLEVQNICDELPCPMTLENCTHRHARSPDQSDDGTYH